MGPLGFHFWLNFAFLMFPTKMSEKSVKTLHMFLLEKAILYSFAFIFCNLLEASHVKESWSVMVLQQLTATYKYDVSHPFCVRK